jgi:hypothetical protein
MFNQMFCKIRCLSQIDYQVEYPNQYQRKCNVLLTVVAPDREKPNVEVSKLINNVWPNTRQNKTFDPMFEKWRYKFDVSHEGNAMYW